MNPKFDPENLYRIISGNQDAEIFAKFKEQWNIEIAQFCTYLQRSFLEWEAAHLSLANSKRGQLVSMLLYSSCASCLESMKLLLSGSIVTSGNAKSMAIESLGAAVLCSHSELNTYDRFADGSWKTNKATRDLKKHRSLLRVTNEFIEAMDATMDACHDFSHPTLKSISWLVSSQALGGPFVGPDFHTAAKETYAADIFSRTSFAKMLIEAIRRTAKGMHATA